MNALFETLLAQGGSSSPPSGGAEASQAIGGTIAAIVITAAMFAVVLGHRNGKVKFLDRLGALAQRETGLPGWASLPLAILGGSLIIAVFGMYWDIATHIDAGRDEGPFANASHYFILAGLFGIFFAGLVAIFLPRERPGRAAIKVPGVGYAPLGGVLAKEAIVYELERGRSNFVAGHTYVGHPVTAAAGVAALRYLLEHELVENSRIQGERLLRRLRELLDRHAIVGDVRGLGLMAGVEFVRDRATKQPFAVSERVVYRIADAALDRGLITYPLQGCVDGVEGDMIKVTPPLCITGDQVDELVGILDESIGAVEAAL
jgi:hypothetical protein